MAQLNAAADETLTTGALGQKLVNSLLSLPSRLAARMRMADELLEQDARRARLRPGDWDEDTYLTRPPPPTFAPLPGPWGFLTSGYAIGLIFMVCIFIPYALSFEIGR
jgi:hypothetical protein